MVEPGIYRGGGGVRGRNFGFVGLLWLGPCSFMISESWVETTGPCLSFALHSLMQLSVGWWSIVGTESEGWRLNLNRVNVELVPPSRSRLGPTTRYRSLEVEAN